MESGEGLFAARNLGVGAGGRCVRLEIVNDHLIDVAAFCSIGRLSLSLASSSSVQICT